MTKKLPLNEKVFWKIQSVSIILLVTIMLGGEPAFHIYHHSFAVSNESSYKPQTRHMVISTVPLVIDEQQNYQPGLKGVFGPKGVLNSTEVYGFNPDTLIVYKGDTVVLSITNTQADDAHTFTIDEPYDIDVGLKPNSTSTVTFVASNVGVYEYYCDISGHGRFMHGTLLVLPDSDATD